MSDNPNNTLSLVPNKTDAQQAAEYRMRLAPLLEQVAQIFQEARSEGFNLAFNISADQYGRVRVQSVDVTKPL